MRTNIRHPFGLYLGMISQMSMKTFFGHFFALVKKQWFLLLMAATITLIVILFEVL